MTAASPDLSQSLRSAIVGNASITALLPAYKGSFPVYTLRPVPTDAPLPMMIVSEDMGVLDNDGVNDFRPTFTRAIMAYSANDTPDNARKAFALALLTRDLFHRNRQAIVVSGWTVVQITATGPAPSFADDQNKGMAVTLAIELAALRS
jgi:hypothetical protein